MKKLSFIAAVLFSFQAYAGEVTIEAIPVLDSFESQSAYFSFEPVIDFQYEVCEEEVFRVDFIPTFKLLNKAAEQSKPVSVTYYVSDDNDFCSVIYVK